jgi:hypothetical protein
MKLRQFTLLAAFACRSFDPACAMAPAGYWIPDGARFRTPRGAQDRYFSTVI